MTKISLENFNVDYLGRPTPLYYAKTLSEYFDAHIYLKREDLNHTGSMQINNAFEQLFHAKTQGYAKAYLKTDNRDFAVACAASCARLQLSLYIESESFDTLSRFRLNLYGMKKISDQEIDESYYRVDKGYFSSVVADELSNQAEDIDTLLCVSENYHEAAALFEPFIQRSKCIAVGSLPSRTQPFLYVQMQAKDSLKAFELIAKSEGIVVSFQSAMALNYLMQNKPKKNENVVIVLSENGDKDIQKAYNEIAL
ncbi:MAG: pyridoxal-phosphate dependent enzyme [Campylobacterales bacterium]|nr:pyridoxal-phosphate dependent enzyme [Campylobacterales bacterium]